MIKKTYVLYYVAMKRNRDHLNANPIDTRPRSGGPQLSSSFTYRVPSMNAWMILIPLFLSSRTLEGPWFFTMSKTKHIKVCLHIFWRVKWERPQYMESTQ